MSDTTDKKTEKKGYSVEVSITMLGEFAGEDFPLESVLRRKLRDVAKDDGRFRVTHLDMAQDELMDVCKLRQKDDDEDD